MDDEHARGNKRILQGLHPRVMSITLRIELKINRCTRSVDPLLCTAVHLAFDFDETVGNYNSHCNRRKGRKLKLAAVVSSRSSYF